MIAYLPLILLIAAAFSSGVTVLLFTIYVRSSRERRNSIFPVVRETEALKATWARLGFILFAIIAALSTGGWFATQQNLSITALAPPNIITDSPTTSDRAAILADILAATPSIAITADIPATATLEPVSFVASTPAVNTPTATSQPATSTPTIIAPSATATAFPTATHTPSPTPSPTSIAATATPQPTNTATATSTAGSENTSTATVTISETPNTGSRPIAPTVTQTATALPTKISLTFPTTGTLILTTNTPTGAIPTEAGPAATVTPTLVPLPAYTKLGPVVFSTAVTPRRFAVDPQTSFDLGVEQIYAVFPYEGMRNGWSFTTIWYFEDREIMHDDLEWTWGTTDQSFTFIRPTTPGRYRIEMRVNGHTMTTESFEIKP